MPFPTRRTFLQTTVATFASFFLPTRGLHGAGDKSRSFWFLHVPTGESWQVDDPVSWSLANARQPILEAARERLVTLLDASDQQRVIRLVTRRCKLNLVEIQPRRVIVHYWGQHGQGDLQPFFKKRRLARKEVEVVHIERKRERSTAQSGDEYLYGERLPPFYPSNVYCKKWQRRFIEESDDCKAAPCSDSNYCWEGVERRCIPWRVLKSAWQHEEPSLCRNCDKPTLLVSFGYFVCGFYKRGPVISRICPLCRRQFEDRSPWDGPKWMIQNLGEQYLPSFEINLLGKVDKSGLPWTPEGQAHDRNLRAVRCLNEMDRRGKYGSYYLCDGKIELWHNNVRVGLPSFDGPEDRLEEWCRQVICSLPAEKSEPTSPYKPTGF